MLLELVLLFCFLCDCLGRFDFVVGSFAQGLQWIGRVVCLSVRLAALLVTLVQVWEGLPLLPLWWASSLLPFWRVWRATCRVLPAGPGSFADGGGARDARAAATT